MTWALQAGDHVVTGASALLKARDRQPFAEALSLLAEAHKIRDRASEDAEHARAAAVAEGRQAGLAEVRDHLAAAVAAFSDTIDCELAARRADIAAAALAAARAIVGMFDEAEVTARIAERALDRVGTHDGLVISVAPAMAAAVRERLADRDGVTVREDDAAAPLDCVLHTGAGRVIASLPLQLDALAARWGVTE